MKSEVRIGISGWNYAGWRGVFYPKGLPHRRELEFASRAFNSIEINGSFYSLQRPTSYRRWCEETPENFRFSVKGARFITHMKKLREVEVPLANFFASGVLALEEKLGPILWQFPPNFSWNESFLVPDFFELLREFNFAFVFADAAGKWPYAEDLTANFVYCRLHGDTQLYTSGYSDRALDWWATRLELWRKGQQPKDAKLVTAKRTSESHDLFVYFDNDAKVHAPFDAQTLVRKMK